MFSKADFVRRFMTTVAVMKGRGRPCKRWTYSQRKFYWFIGNSIDANKEIT